MQKNTFTLSSIKEKLKKHIKAPVFEEIVMRFFASWCLTSIFYFFLNRERYLDKSIFSNMDTVFFVVIFVLIFFLLFSLKILFNKIKLDFDALMLGTSSLAYGVCLLATNNDYYFMLGVILAVCLIWIYLLREDRLGFGEIKISSKSVRIVMIAVFAASAGFIGVYTVFKSLSLYAPNFDDGLFAQTYYYMKTTGMPMNTCERDVLLSHFSIHVSPIFYLLLPGYFIFPHPIYLQVMQAIVIASGIVPLYLIAKHKGVTGFPLVFVCVAYGFYPANIGGAWYSIHENMFLLPLILWTMYFFEKRRFPLMYLFAVLVLFVKEDAAVYVAVLALYMLVSCKEYKHGSILLGVSLVYFFAVLTYLNLYGRGVMSYLYSNFLNDVENDSMVSIAINIIKNPGYMLSQLFNEEKLKFFFYMFLPVAFVPFFCKKYSRLILLIPMLIVNFISDHSYQSNISFQYTFGASAILFYMTVINLADMKDKGKRFLTALGAICSVLVFSSTMLQNLDYIDRYMSDREKIAEIREVMQEIPDDASVTASTFFIAPLSQRDVIYEDFYHENGEKTDYVILDTRGDTKAEEILDYQSEGYEIVSEVQNGAVLMKNTK